MQERSLYVVRYEVEPVPGTENFEQFSGALVNVWTEAASEQQAISIAAREVQAAGWSIAALEAVHPTSRADYNEDSSGLAYFEQALVDGLVLAFHTWQEGTQH